MLDKNISNIYRKKIFQYLQKDRAGGQNSPILAKRGKWLLTVQLKSYIGDSYLILSIFQSRLQITHL